MAYNPYAYANQMYNQVYPNFNQGYSMQPSMPQQSFTPRAQGMEWVDGEVGAKAFQMPQGWPVGQPIALWDTNDQVIYLKSINQMGMPNPLQKIRYQMEEQPVAALPATGTVSGAAEAAYATKEDFEKLMDEVRGLKDMVVNKAPYQNNKSGNSNNQNRGGNT